ncbi:hypothetical protein L6452_13195 [Arctium lappa]|uniref:Uncharacterized protein n=1 Tax=Arctium lappa TaxID=4217 RepID=A0ACB9CHM0_ARCLA|nr:hypothetical protein L6452_13195 [Arctium lappa]
MRKRGKQNNKPRNLGKFTKVDRWFHFLVKFPETFSSQPNPIKSKTLLLMEISSLIHLLNHIHPSIYLLQPNSCCTQSILNKSTLQWHHLLLLNHGVMMFFSVLEEQTFATLLWIIFIRLLNRKELTLTRMTKHFPGVKPSVHHF